MKPPAANPCGSCPYRLDVPSGVWSLEEYAKLPPYDAETGDQPMGVFMCHRQDGNVCAGWAGCHDMNHMLSLRLGAATGRIDQPTLEALFDYETSTPLYSSGTEAAEHGVERINDPDEAARRIIQKLDPRRG